jgi:hypothetical protein
LLESRLRALSGLHGFSDCAAPCTGFASALFNEFLEALKITFQFKISDREAKAWLLEDTEPVSEKKRRVEEHIRIVDARWRLLIESAAREDIEVYKQRSLVSN